MSRNGGFVIGIDLGTTNSCGAVWRAGAVVVIPDAQGRRTVPSAVAFDQNYDDDDEQPVEPLIGTATRHLAAQSGRATVRSVKRLIGRRWEDPRLQSDLPRLGYTVVKGDCATPEVHVAGRAFRPEEISAFVLRHLKENAEEFLGVPVVSAVVTVPAYFNDGQRQATRAAAKLAGLDVLKILNEPTAAALAYGVDLRRLVLAAEDGDSEHDSRAAEPKLILVFDLGGGTCDVSLLEVAADEGLFEVKATVGDGNLGGDDWDSKLVDYLVEDFRRRHRKCIPKDDRAMRRLRDAAEEAKRTLSFAVSADIEIDCLFDGTDYHSRISRAWFESLCEDLFHRCAQLVKRAINDGRADKGAINEVILVGGSTRMPKVQGMIRDILGHSIRINNEVNADEVVACGAAIQGALIAAAQNRKAEDEPLLADIVLQDVTPLGFGIETAGGLMTSLVPRNCPIPCSATLPFTTYATNQQVARIKVYQGERAMAADNFFVGEFTLRGLPPAKRTELRIDVTLCVDSDGCLTVEARERGGAAAETVQIAVQNHAATAIEAAVNSAVACSRGDREKREIVKLRHELENYAWAALENPESDEATTETAEAALEWLQFNGAVADLNALLTRRALLLGGKDLPAGRALPATPQLLQLPL